MVQAAQHRLSSRAAPWHARVIEQLGLFDSATAHLAAARRALAAFDLDAAERNLLEHTRIFTADRVGAALLGRVQHLREIRDAAACDAGEIDTLLALQAVVPEELLCAWHGRVALVVERELGPAARVAGELPGVHWLRAGEYARAVESLRAALGHDHEDARARGFLADALHRSGAEEQARREYVRAFMQDPEAIALADIADSAVVRLVDLARYVYELGEPAAAWVPAVGIVERVFALPQAGLPELMPAVSGGTGPAAFVDLIARERAGRTLDERVAARRQMKAGAPALFAAYLERFA